MINKHEPSDAYDVKKANIDYYDSLQTGPARQITPREAGRAARMIASRTADPDAKYNLILETGSGPGWLSAMAVSSGLARCAVATDISGGMLRASRETAALNSLQVSQAQCDSQRLPFLDNTFDLVLGGGFLHHLEDEEQFFREAKRVLAPGGSLLIFREPQTAGSAVVAAIVKALAFLPAAIIKLFRKRERQILKHELEKTYTASALARYGAAAGFRLARCGGHSFLHSIHWFLSTKTARIPGANSVMKLLLPAADFLDEKLLKHILPKWMFYEISACFIKE